MKNKLYLLAISIGLSLSLTPFLRDVLAAGSPVGSPTVPPSSVGGAGAYNRGYGNYADPIGQYGNLVVTGNVTGGRHFRGIVPYRSVSEFTAPLGSSSLNSFLRRSAGVYYTTEQAPGETQPYYLPSQTVTSIGRGGRLAPTTPRIGFDQETGQFLPPLSKTRLDQEQETEETPLYEFDQQIYRKSRPVSVLGEELEELLSKLRQSEQEEAEATEPVLPDEQIAELRRGLDEAKKRAQEIDRKIDEMSLPRPDAQDRDLDPFRPLEPEEPEDHILQPLEPLQTLDEAEEEPEPLDVYQQMLRQVQEETQRVIEQTRQKEKLPVKEEEKEKSPPAFLTDPASGDARRDGGQKQEGETEEPEFDPLADLAALEMPELKTPFARIILGLRRSFATDKEDKFNEYLRAAQDFMKQGKYYRAADAYTIASIYEPKNPLPYAGKAHALFAAGEYVSSALFLSKAIEIFPAYTRFRVDLVEMIGDRDKLESRILDLTKWQHQTGSPELQFLLAYVFYNTGNLSFAKEAIDAAHQKMSDSRAVVKLKRTIDNIVGQR